MNKATMLLLAGSLTTACALAQQKPAEKTEEVTVTITDTKGEKGEKGSKNEERTVIVIENGKVTINGKPAEQYKGSKRIVIDGQVGSTVTINGNTMRATTLPRSPRPPRVAAAPASPRAYLGVSTEDHQRGARITEVIEGTAAETAGLKEGDVIVTVGGKAVKGPESLAEVVRSFQPQETVDIAILRDGQAKKVKATLGKTEAGAWSWSEDFMDNFGENFKIDGDFRFDGPLPPGAFNFDQFRGMMMTNDRPKFGMNVEDNADGDGAKVSSVEEGSNAAKAGLQKDDIITEVDGQPIKNIDELRMQLAQLREKSVLQVKVDRSGKTENLTLRVPKKIKTAEL
ncbi:MAG: PDZ domain-containing protein [Chitinophagaceae bacterium]|nr:PDZ domain-containing protein [Chitinophagaceae bacterium]